MRTQAEIGVAGVLDRAARLGFRGRDLDELGPAAEEVFGTSTATAEVADRAAWLRAGIGDYTVSGPDPWQGMGGGPDDGLVPMLALIVAADDVVAHLRKRGVSEAEAWLNLSDLGQQVWVHRLTYARFGLHTHGWLRIAWSGGFAWLGRLQFNLQPLGPTGARTWVLSTHIPRRGSDHDGPRSGALTGESVDDSFARAVRYFAEHYPELPTHDFWCHSWLLDPALASALPGSNIAAFQRRWVLEDHAGDGDDDAVFFTFARRRPVPLDELPRRTRLERAVLERLERGDHWALRTGRIPQSAYARAGSATAADGLRRPGQP
ncbi:MAG TPA: acyltransferase domain-containing protein [Microlunatus sp.]|nr:acyltransferase domain-containing protein [Microlunatus sp.]